ncbi:MAG: family 20 glycosylhydrolase [Lentisphaerae bacterium]|nr:family 20 glycosylhydrolase [Lentisphaerota bacterium]
MKVHFKYKAIQYDVSRGVIPRLKTVEDRIEQLVPFGLNMVFFYMESVIDTAVLPAVGCGKTPVTFAYLKKLKKICEKHGVLLAPVLQILGHQEKLLALDKYEWMGEVPPPRNRSSSNNFRIDSPRVREILFKWLDEILPYFHPPFVHLGCDEVWALGTGRSKNAIARLGFEKAVAGYISEFNDYIKKRGLRAIIWPDLIINHPKLLKHLPKDIILANWNYGIYEESYEQDNKHFAAQKHLAALGHENWVCGNNQAECAFNIYQRMRDNTAIWLDLARKYGAEGFVITDWPAFFSLPLYVSSVLGDQFVLMQLEKPSLTLKEFSNSFTRHVLGRTDAGFQRALETMLMAQHNTKYWPKRLLYIAGPFRSLMLDDPGGNGSMARRFASCEREGLERFLADMRKANKLMTGVKVKNPARKDYLNDFVMLSNRLLMIALRAMLWHEYVWDTTAVLPEREARLKKWFDEYMALSWNDLLWYKKRWYEENLEGEWSKTKEILENARKAIAKIFPRCSNSTQ